MKKDNIFWIGYADLMTSLFFVMLVLFVVIVGYLKSTLDTKKEELKKIEELQKAVENLPEEYFQYQPQYKRFKLKKPVHFDPGKSDIKNKYNKYLIEVGNSIINLINEMQSDSTYNKYDIKYLVVIEGMASKDNYPLNYELSYKRALSLYKLWKANGILFDANTCEVQISGSGMEGIREYSGAKEKQNQQFLIHIIPKMGKIVQVDE